MCPNCGHDKVAINGRTFGQEPDFLCQCKRCDGRFRMPVNAWIDAIAESTQWTRRWRRFWKQVS